MSKITDPTPEGRINEPESPLLSAADLRTIEGHIDQIITQNIPLEPSVHDALKKTLLYIAENAWHKAAERDGVHTMTWEQAASEYRTFSNSDRLQTSEALKALAGQKSGFNLTIKKDPNKSDWQLLPTRVVFSEKQDSIPVDSFGNLCQKITEVVEAIGKEKAIAEQQFQGK